MKFNELWLQRGYFDFSSEDHRRAPTQIIRKELATMGGLPADGFSIRSYPVGPSWRHTFWWREGDTDYAEAQFFMQIGHYPVLSLGVSVEKGREDAATPADRLMKRQSWDWQRFVDCADALLETDVPLSSANLPQPISVRVELLPRAARPEGIDNRSFSFVEGRWYERLKGTADAEDISAYIRLIDQQRDCWVLAYFVMDLSSQAIHGVDPTVIAQYLFAFNRIRQRLRGIRLEDAPSPGDTPTRS